MATESPTTAAEEPRLTDQDRAILRARELVRRLPVVLDTETTGQVLLALAYELTEAERARGFVVMEDDGDLPW